MENTIRIHRTPMSPIENIFISYLLIFGGKRYYSTCLCWESPKFSWLLCLRHSQSSRLDGVLSFVVLDNAAGYFFYFPLNNSSLLNAGISERILSLHQEVFRLNMFLGGFQKCKFNLTVYYLEREHYYNERNSTQRI